MIGRKATVGLSLLCALLFSAFVVQSASAAVGTNITAFTCESVASGATFSDAHCDTEKAGGAGFVHKEIPVKTSTKIEVTNVTTGAATSEQTLKGEPFKVPTHIICKTLGGKGVVENSEPTAKVHKLTGSGTLEYSNCEAKEVANCTKVKEPIVAKIGSVESQEGLTGPKGEANAMGLEFKSEAGKPFAEVTLEGTCAIAGKAFPVEGSVIVTNGPGEAEAQNKKFSGATAVVTEAMSKEKLTIGGKKATYIGTATYKMEGVGGAAITTTTVT